MVRLTWLRLPENIPSAKINLRCPIRLGATARLFPFWRITRNIAAEITKVTMACASVCLQEADRMTNWKSLPQKNNFLVTWNINGLRSFQKDYDLKEFLEHYNIDILNLQETKLVDGWDIKKKLQLEDNWHIYQNTASSRKGYAGVASISKLNLTQLKIDMPNKRFQEEGRMLLFQYQDASIINVYFPQGDRTKKDVPYKLEVCDYITEMIQSKQGKWLISGDFNMARQELDLARPKQNLSNNMFTKEERERMARLTQIGLLDVFRTAYPKEQKFTWWPYAYNARERNVGWRLDYIFVSECLKDRIKRVEILKEVLGSDHCPVLMEVEM